MANRPKAIGTAAETLVTRWLRTNGYPHARRLALAGASDTGDIEATPGLMLEVKAGQQTRRPGDADLEAWCQQTAAETTFYDDLTCAGGSIGLLVLQRHGTRDVSRWWVVTRGTWQGYVWRELGDVLHDAAIVPVRLQPDDPNITMPSDTRSPHVTGD